MKPSELVAKGWCQGTGSIRREGVTIKRCVLHAIDEAYGAIRAREVTEKLRRHVGNYYINDWNDAPGRTQAEVVAALRAIGE